MRRPVTAYVGAIAALAAAVLLRWLLDPVMGDSLPLVTLFGAIAAGVWIGGYRPAVLVAILGYLACNWLFIEPRGQLHLERHRRPGRAHRLSLYLLPHHRVRRGDAPRADARSRARRAAARDPRQYRRCGGHDRSRRPHRLSEPGRRVPDRLVAARGPRSSRSRKCSGSSTSKPAGRSRARQRGPCGKAPSWAWRTTRSSCGKTAPSVPSTTAPHRSGTSEDGSRAAS